MRERSIATRGDLRIELGLALLLLLDLVAWLDLGGLVFVCQTALVVDLIDGFAHASEFIGGNAGSQASGRSTPATRLALQGLGGSRHGVPKPRFLSDIVRGIAAISDKNREREHAVQLLLRAIRTLPDADQDLVLALMLEGLAGSADVRREAGRPDQRRRTVVALRGTSGLEPGRPTAADRQRGASAEPRVVPVRFPAELHEQFRAWCEEHRFPMAAVVRGLVEQFLASERLP